MINCKGKGDDFERKVARILSASTCMRWERTAYSGSKATVSGDSCAALLGDVYCLDGLNQNVVVETKKHGKLVKGVKEKLLFSDVLLGRKTFKEDWSQLKREMNEYSLPNVAGILAVGFDYDPLIYFFVLNSDNLGFQFFEPLRMVCVLDAFVCGEVERVSVLVCNTGDVPSSKQVKKVLNKGLQAKRMSVFETGYRETIKSVI